MRLLAAKVSLFIVEECSVAQGSQQEGERQGVEGEAGVRRHDGSGQASCLGARANHSQAYQGCPTPGAHRWANSQLLKAII
jgi:hypothetical protein